MGERQKKGQKTKRSESREPPDLQQEPRDTVKQLADFKLTNAVLFNFKCAASSPLSM